MRALLIAPIQPARGGNGLAMRVALFAEALARFSDLDVMIIPVAGQASWPADDLRANFHVLKGEPDTHFKLLMRIVSDEARLAAFRAYGKPSLAAALSDEIFGEIHRTASDRGYDLVHIARSYLMPLVEVLPKRTPVTVDLDEDDFVSTLSQSRIAGRSCHPFKARWLDAEASAFERIIGQYKDRIWRFFISSKRDGASLAHRHPGLHPSFCPNAIAVPPFYSRLDGEGSIVFIGSFGYEPNVDGLLWFVERVAPRISTRRHGFLLHIAGPNAPQKIVDLKLRPSFRVLGTVRNVADLYRNATIAIAPTRMGGGSRTKIIEAAAYGVASVVHEESADILDESPLPIGWRASEEHGFAAACAEALENATERRKRQNAARRFAIRNYQRQSVVSTLAAELCAALPN
jgi:polysaccharide biosynthesis protein PslH